MNDTHLKRTMNNHPATTPARWWDLTAALILLAMILTAALRLAATHWTEYLPLVQTITVLGVIAGLALAQSRFSSSTVVTFAFIYGIFFISWQLGLTVGEGIDWPERMLRVGHRLLITIEDLIEQQPVSDNLFFLLLMSTLFWTVTVFGAYNLVRHAQAWQAILPAGLALMVIHIYDSFFSVRTWFLAGFIFFALLLLARVHFLRQHSRWRQNGTYTPPYAGLDFIRVALVATAVVVLLAWTVPALASSLDPAEKVWQRVSRPWLELRDRFSNAFSSLQASVGFVNDFYGDSLSLGRGNPLSDTVVMTIDAPPRISAGVRYYWRARVYDRYDSAWKSTLSTTQPVTPEGFDLNLPEYDERTIEEFTIETAYPIKNLYAPSQPVWADRPVELHLAINPDGTVDIVNMEATPYINGGSSYQVRASLSTATIVELRESGTDYPNWVTERYLQLPDTITDRTKELAAQIAAGKDTTYDKVQAVTSFLRENLTYSDTVPNPPNGQEPIDWILFDHRQAFCNYYASAEVIMLRSLGIPARLAVGYAQGDRLSFEGVDVIPTVVPGSENIPPEQTEFTSERDTYTVRHRDLHAWPEVFFPDLGWVEFEPTASQLAIFRPSGEELTPNEAEDPINDVNLNDPANLRNQPIPDDAQPSLDDFTVQEFHLPRIYYGLIAGVVVLLLGLVTRRVRQQRGSPPIPVQIESGLKRIGIDPPLIIRRWTFLATMSPLAKAYREMNRALSRLGSPAKPAETPAERAANLRRIMPEAGDSIASLLGEYQAATYSLFSGNSRVAQLAGKDIRNTSYLAKIKGFFARFQEPNDQRKSLIDALRENF